MKDIREQILDILGKYMDMDWDDCADEILALIAKEPIINPNQPIGSTIDFIIKQEQEGVTADNIIWDCGLFTSSYRRDGTPAFKDSMRYEVERNAIKKAMEVYAKSKLINLRDELIKYDRAYWGLRGDSEKQVDEYLKQRNNGKP